jgi:hypothetical protein
MGIRCYSGAIRVLFGCYSGAIRVLFGCEAPLHPYTLTPLPPELETRITTVPPNQR